MDELKRNSESIERETIWLGKVIDASIKLYFHNKCHFKSISEIQPPDLDNDNSGYSSLVKSMGFGYEERLVLILALSPHIQPHLLDIFFTRNSNFDRGFSEFGGIKGKSHGGFLPTGETALFILSGGNIKTRLLTKNILNESSLFRENILKLLPVETGEPIMAGALVVSDEYLSLVISGKTNKPDFNMFFPAKLVTTQLKWSDLVLEKHVKDELEEIKHWIIHGHALLNDKIIGKKIKPGYKSLFYGPPGTGKTLAACLIGKSTGKDVYRVDLSMVVSKYIGETEKNLANIFDMGQNKNWVLFFDEADALFGKRSLTSSSNDRYANQEVAYLLQRIEDYPGVIILASNLKANLDEAFARRFQSMIYFPMPAFSERLALWKNTLAESIELHPDVELDKIAEKYSLSGGAISNVLRYCTLKAIAHQNKFVTNNSILEGVKREYKKVGKTI